MKDKILLIIAMVAMTYSCEQGRPQSDQMNDDQNSQRRQERRQNRPKCRCDNTEQKLQPSNQMVEKSEVAEKESL